jgi:hypothetical protein
MMTRTVPLVILIAIAASACASAPTGPSVMVLPGTGKSMEQFQTEDGRCRQVALRELEAVRPGQVSDQRRYDMAYIQCMYAAGNQVPVSGRPGYSSPTGPPQVTRPSDAPPPPAGTPPPPPPTPR